MLKRSTLALLTGTVLALGCGGTTTVSDFPATVTIKLGEEIQLLDPDLTLRFAEVITDSRCPIDVVCVQEGSAVLRFSLIDPNGALNTVQLETGKPAEASHGLSFRLTALAPLPRSTQPIDPRDYRATLEIQRGPS